MRKGLNDLMGAMAMLTMFNADDVWSEDCKRGDNELTPDKIRLTQVRVIPKGCKEYYFNSAGQFDTSDCRTHHITKEQTVFITVASSDKSAIAKFNKHIKNTTHE